MAFLPFPSASVTLGNSLLPAGGCRKSSLGGRAWRPTFRAMDSRQSDGSGVIDIEYV
jgi:hypothetical protein